MNKRVFFRNDDVRNSLDQSLVAITDLFMDYGVPIVHAVEPANVTSDVAEWMVSVKTKHPGLIDIVQHGYHHNIDNASLAMEFGGARSYEEQLRDIDAGKKLMTSYFSDLWTPVFTFPYGTYNTYTIKAIQELNYLGVSSSVKFDRLSGLKNKLGQIMHKDTIFGKKISYHTAIRCNTNLYELSVSVSIIKEYINNYEAKHYSFDDIIKTIEFNFKHTDTVGILLHHRYHDKEIFKIRDIIQYCIDSGYDFVTIGDTIDEYWQ